MSVTTWLVANVTPTGSAVVVDKSLSIEGAAADSKVVGKTCYRTLKQNGEFTPVFGTYNVAIAAVKAIASELGMSKASIDRYYWVVTCTSPASSNEPADLNADYCQVLTGYKHGHTGNVVKFYRYSETTIANGRQWSPWLSNTPYVVQNMKTDFDTVLGTYTIAIAAVKAIASELGMSKASIDRYYWVVTCTSPCFF